MIAGGVPPGGNGGGAPPTQQPGLTSDQVLLERLKFWKGELTSGSIDQATYEMAIKSLLPAANPITPPVAVLRTEDTLTTKNDIIDSTVKEWYGSVTTGLKISSEAWTVFTLNGKDKNQRDEVENHCKASNLNVRLTSCFVKSEGKTLAWLAPKDTDDENDVVKSYVANQAVLYYIADLAAITIAWWLFPKLDNADQKNREVARATAKNSLIKEQNDQAMITKLRTYMLNQQKKSGGDEDSDRVPCPTCGKKHLGVCWKAARAVAAPPAKKARTEPPKSAVHHKVKRTGKKKPP